jgi:PhzF family phenazine biosynthesis protein
MGQRITQVDAFTSEPFRGNPAAICLLREEADPGWMQRVALEMNLSETAYLVPRADGFGLRWFTPTVEVDLCGHATVAAAHVLWQERVVPTSDECRFHTRSGLLTARLRGDWISVEFPHERVIAAQAPGDAERALGVKAVAAAISARLKYLVLELASEDAVRGCVPNFSALQQVDFEGVIITSRAAAGVKYSIASRFFAPRKGVNEDPATGSAHCILGPYWQPKLGRNEFAAYQASARGADIRVAVGTDRVTLSGQAVTVLRGELV